MIRRRISALTLAAALAGTALLSGCGSDDEPDSTDSSSSESEDTTTEEESEPEETETEETESEAPDDEGEDGKPSKQDVVTGYNAIITEQMPSLPKQSVNQVTTCFVDEIYDEASAQTLQAIADENAQGVDPNDASLFTDAQTVCTEELTP